jgi:ABC-type transport system substrate-binding protein
MRRWPRLTALTAVAVAVAGVLLFRAGDEPTPGPDRPQVGIRVGGTARVATAFDVTGFNPNTSKDGGPGVQDVAETMYPSVFRIHPDFSVQLDKTFMVSAELTSRDPQTITYRIRPEAHWSDGVPITADDFSYLWKHLNGKTTRPTRSPPPATTGSSR